jgi:hypothetical protein
MLNENHFISNFNSRIFFFDFSIPLDGFCNSCFTILFNVDNIAKTGGFIKPVLTSDHKNTCQKTYFVFY